MIKIVKESNNEVLFTTNSLLKAINFVIEYHDELSMTEVFDEYIDRIKIE